ncbi:response regulator transcription factor [Pleurocapsa sp. PCC 7319]|uniref:response regulator transcription factor n=1 Tax=Pleurocapsa sp. PCC 7319 TaxID=118161 RepID=UPI0003483CDA|nr:response regulator transcription factor [Pleurocapsa sp. PCC 7319]
MKKILVVDDDLILRKVLQNSLEQRGYQVISVSSAKEALKKFSQDVPDIIVSDVSMPEMNGFEFCRQLRSQPSGKLIPFIFLSAKDELDYRIQGHSIGADNYLVKPFEMKELLANIEALIERSRRVHAEIVHLIEQLVSAQSTNILNTVKDNFEPQDNTREKTSNTEQSTAPEPLPLTPAEERVFWETIQGFTNKQISERLFISPRTVQTHLSNILNKLNLSNRTQLVRFAYEQGYEKVESK